MVTASARGVSGAEEPGEEEGGGERMCGGRRCRQREKSGEGKTVRALTRMLVTGSSRVRCGLNWYLWEGGGGWLVWVSLEKGVCKGGVGGEEGGRGQIELIKLASGAETDS